MIAGLNWWMYFLVIVAIFGSFVIAHFIVKKMNEVRMEERLAHLHNKTSVSIQVSPTIIAVEKPNTQGVTTAAKQAPTTVTNKPESSTPEGISFIFSKEQNSVKTPELTRNEKKTMSPVPKCDANLDSNQTVKSQTVIQVGSIGTDTSTQSPFDSLTDSRSHTKANKPIHNLSLCELTALAEERYDVPRTFHSILEETSTRILDKAKAEDVKIDNCAPIQPHTNNDNDVKDITPILNKTIDIKNKICALALPTLDKDDSITNTIQKLNKTKALDIKVENCALVQSNTSKDDDETDKDEAVVTENPTYGKFLGTIYGSTSTSQDAGLTNPLNKPEQNKERKTIGKDTEPATTTQNTVTEIPKTESSPKYHVKISEAAFDDSAKSHMDNEKSDISHDNENTLAEFKTLQDLSRSKESIKKSVSRVTFKHETMTPNIDDLKSIDTPRSRPESLKSSVTHSKESIKKQTSKVTFVEGIKIADSSSDSDVDVLINSNFDVSKITDSMTRLSERTYSRESKLSEKTHSKESFKKRSSKVNFVDQVVNINADCILRKNPVRRLNSDGKPKPISLKWDKPVTGSQKEIFDQMSVFKQNLDQKLIVLISEEASTSKRDDYKRNVFSGTTLSGAVDKEGKTEVKSDNIEKDSAQSTIRGKSDTSEETIRPNISLSSNDDAPRTTLNEHVPVFIDPNHTAGNIINTPLPTQRRDGADLTKS